MISIETNMDVNQQILMVNGKLLDNDSKQVKQYGVSNDDFIMLTSMSMMQAANQ